VIFKEVREGRPYPDHGFSARDWARIPPHQVRLDTLVTTKRELGLDTLLAEDSTFYGDLFPHAVQWRGELYLEDGLHRCLRAALQQRTAVHVRVLNLDEVGGMNGASDPTGTLRETGTPAGTGTADETGTLREAGTPAGTGTADETGTLRETGTPGEAGTAVEGTPRDAGAAAADAADADAGRTRDSAADQRAPST
jgi:Arc/MetJ family transcription regulator